MRVFKCELHMLHTDIGPLNILLCFSSKANSLNHFGPHFESPPFSKVMHKVSQALQQ